MDVVQFFQTVGDKIGSFIDSITNATLKIAEIIADVGTYIGYIIGILPTELTAVLSLGAGLLAVFALVRWIT